MLRGLETIFSLLRILTSLFFPNLYFFIFLVQNLPAKFEITLRPSKRVSTPIIIFTFFFFFFSGMTTSFGKVKLAEIQEKKAKASLIGGLLTRKR